MDLSAEEWGGRLSDAKRQGKRQLSDSVHERVAQHHAIDGGDAGDGQRRLGATISLGLVEFVTKEKSTINCVRILGQLLTILN